MKWQRMIAAMILVTLVAHCAGSVATPTIDYRDYCEEQHTRGRICVLVRDADRPLEVAGARVFIMSAGGAETESATTDQLGQASLNLPHSTVQPKYVLVEKDGYFIGGLPWQEGTHEYYILLKLAAIR